MKLFAFLLLFLALLAFSASAVELKSQDDDGLVVLPLQIFSQNLPDHECVYYSQLADLFLESGLDITTIRQLIAEEHGIDLSKNPLPIDEVELEYEGHTLFRMKPLRNDPMAKLLKNKKVPEVEERES